MAEPIAVVTAYEDDPTIGPWASVTYLGDDRLDPAGGAYRLEPFDDPEHPGRRWLLSPAE
jgi:hypothetical protein